MCFTFPMGIFLLHKRYYSAKICDQKNNFNFVENNPNRINKNIKNCKQSKIGKYIDKKNSDYKFFIIDREIINNFKINNKDYQNNEIIIKYCKKQIPDHRIIYIIKDICNDINVDNKTFMF